MVSIIPDKHPIIQETAEFISDTGELVDISCSVSDHRKNFRHQVPIADVEANAGASERPCTKASIGCIAHVAVIGPRIDTPPHTSIGPTVTKLFYFEGKNIEVMVMSTGHNIDGRMPVKHVFHLVPA
jgi:hypothetical protein